MNNHEFGFMRIMIIIIAIIAFLLISGVDIQETISSEKLQNFLESAQIQVTHIYNTYLKDIVETGIITPAETLWNYITIYVISPIVNFLELALSKYGQ